MNHKNKILLSIVFLLCNCARHGVRQPEADPPWAGKGTTKQNLVKNGNFEKAKKSKIPVGPFRVKIPINWHNCTPGDIHHRVKEGKNILWNKTASKTGKCVEFVLNEPAPQWTSIADIEGIKYGTDPIFIDTGYEYRIAVDVKSVSVADRRFGPDAFVFVEGYRTTYQDVEDVHQGSSTTTLKIYVYQMHCRTKKDAVWEHFEKTLEIKKPTIEWITVNLYGYYPRGLLYFDNVILEKLEKIPED